MNTQSKVSGLKSEDGASETRSSASALVGPKSDGGRITRHGAITAAFIPYKYISDSRQRIAVKDDTRPKRLALVQEIQHHPLSGNILHVDFHEVAENEKVTIMVPVETTGEAVGVKTSGGVLEHVLFKIKARALPKDLPEQIIVDVSNLNIGQAIHLGEIQAPAGVELIGDKNIPVIAVAAPRTEEEEAAAKRILHGLSTPVAIHITSNYSSNQHWPLEHWAELVRRREAGEDVTVKVGASSGGDGGPAAAEAAGESVLVNGVPVPGFLIERSKARREFLGV